VIDALVPGLAPPSAYAMTPETFLKTWHFAFNALPDLPEALIAGRERLYRMAVSQPLVRPGDGIRRLRDRRICRVLFARWRDAGRLWLLPRDLHERRAEPPYAAAGKVKAPILAVGGAQWLGPAIVSTFEAIGETVSGALVDNCGHFVPEEQADKLAELILELYGA
jgi:pimeloyl-ACP methyl ester carboxylesterase